MKHQLKITRSNKKDGAVLDEKVEEFFSLYNAERRMNDINEKYHEKNKPHNSCKEIVNTEIIKMESQSWN